ncbi:hypothetical protein HMI55_007265 [Coelomomyces lativittatus]|nr:hypothetical protein HMI55_007265 [Coelomomyces lativittatus]
MVMKKDRDRYHHLYTTTRVPPVRTPTTFTQHTSPTAPIETVFLNSLEQWKEKEMEYLHQLHLLKREIDTLRSVPLKSLK